jgi:phage terminase small subunit
MSMSPEQKEVNKIIKNTIKEMQEVNTYKPQFDATVKIYAETQQIYNRAYKDFIISGGRMMEEYTNNSGFTNIRKTATYLAIENLRSDLVNYRSILGLTPLGLKKINDEMKAKKKTSKLTQVMSKNG